MENTEEAVTVTTENEPVALTALRPLPCATAQKVVPFQAMASQLALNGMARAVHVMPSEDVALTLEPDTAQNKPDPFVVIADQFCGEGIERIVHVIPSGDVKVTSLGTPPTTEKLVPFQAIAVQKLEIGKVR